MMRLLRSTRHIRTMNTLRSSGPKTRQTRLKQHFPISRSCLAILTTPKYWNGKAKQQMSYCVSSCRLQRLDDLLQHRPNRLKPL